jgi:hypothetical protein
MYIICSSAFYTSVEYKFDICRSSYNNAVLSKNINIEDEFDQARQQPGLL